MQERVGELAPVGGLEVRDQSERAVVEPPMADPAKRQHAIRVVAAASRARDEVSGVNRSAGPARHPGTPCHLAR